MINKYFEDEEITENDLLFMCFMIELVARKLRQRNKYVVNTVGYDNLYHLISVASVLHCENPDKVADDWIKDFGLNCKMKLELRNWDKGACPFIPIRAAAGPLFSIFL